MPSASGGRPAGLRWVVAAVALLPPLAQFGFLIGKGRESWPLLFADDAYYYFGVAMNIASGHGSTFSGLTETNGYHPIWMLVLSGVAAVVRDPHHFLVAVVVVQSLLWVALVREAVLLGRRLGAEGPAVIGVAALGVLAVITGQLSFSGMESAPLLVVLLLAVRLIVQIDDDDRPAHAELRVGLVLALVCLTRLDAALTAVPLAAVAALRGRATLGLVARRGVRLVGPLAVAIAGYIAASLVVFGTPSPVSGQAKSLGAPFFNTLPVKQSLQAGQIGGRPLWLGALALVMLAVAIALRDRNDSAPGRRLLWCGLAFVAGQAFLFAYLTVATSYPIWAWYHYNSAMVAFCAATLIARSLATRYERPVAMACLAIGATFAVVQLPTVYSSNLNHRPEAVETARFIDDQLPSDAVLAMGDRAGLVGYLGDRPMLQTEGLMADAQWLHDLESGAASERMAAEGVEYFLWSGVVAGRPAEIDGRTCIVLAEPRAGEGPKFDVTVCDADRVFTVGEGNDRMTIWHYRPQLNG